MFFKSNLNSRTGLQDYGISLNIREIDDVFTAFDRDRSGFIDVTEFLVACRGDLNDRRKKMVKMAFDILDKDRSGVVTVDEMMEAYDFTKNPEVIAGKKSLKEAAVEFMRQWDRHDVDGIVSYEEFEDYYKEISASIDGDDYFELMIRNAWRIAGGEGAAANTANKRVLITNKDGSQQVVTVNNELGMKQGKDQAAMADIRKRLGQQGVEASNIELFGGMEISDKPKKVKMSLLNILINIYTIVLDLIKFFDINYRQNQQIDFLILQRPLKILWVFNLKVNHLLRLIIL